MKNIDEARQALCEGRPEALLGLEESGWLDVKSGPYQLDKPSGKEELAKDVAGFANTSTGGLVLIGFGTKQADSVETVSTLVPVPRNQVDVDRYRKVIDERVVPVVRDLSVHWLDCGGGKGILVIDIPKQPANSLPFVIPGPTSPDSRLKKTVAVPMRRGDRIPQLPIEELQRLLAAGWAATGGPAEEFRSDRVKAGRVLTAVPSDAPWIRVLAQQAPMRRVSVEVVHAVGEALDEIKSDSIDFLDDELVTAYSRFLGALNDLHDELEGMFESEGSADAPAYFEVPPEWKRTEPEQYRATLERLSRTRDAFLEERTKLLNAMNRKGLLA
ncbi:AlbA family DNA-binding domain-containing protein [Streptomyces sp. NPDC002676]